MNREGEKKGHQHEFNPSPSDATLVPLNAATAAAAAAASAGLRLPFPMPYVAQQADSSSSASLHMANVNAAIYQSPLWQAAIRQQQLQLISHIASLNPFLHNPLQQPLPQPPTASALRAAATSYMGGGGGRRGGDDSAESSNVEVYREYLAKFVQLQQAATSSSSTSNDGMITTTTSSDDPTTDTKSAKSVRPIIDSSGQSSSVDGNTIDKGMSIIEIEDTGNLSSQTANNRKSTPTATAASAKDLGLNGGGGGRDKVFTCKICNRSFGYKHVLQNHERTHTGEKPFECKVCHKRFTRDHHLKTHMRLHTGEKPYSCSHCERQFVQVANLRRHLRVHTGERPYRCDACGSCFSDSNQLKAHNLIHKGEKPFACELCGGKFRRRHHLMHHACPKQEAMDEDLSPEKTLESSPSSAHPESGGDQDKRRQRKARDPKRYTAEGSSESAASSPKLEPFQTEPEDLSSSRTAAKEGGQFDSSMHSYSPLESSSEIL